MSDFRYISMTDECSLPHFRDTDVTSTRPQTRSLCTLVYEEESGKRGVCGRVHFRLIVLNDSGVIAKFAQEGVPAVCKTREM